MPSTEEDRSEVMARADNITFDAVVELKDLKAGSDRILAEEGLFPDIRQTASEYDFCQGPIYFIRLFIYCFKGLVYGLISAIL